MEKQWENLWDHNVKQDIVQILLLVIKINWQTRLYVNAFIPNKITKYLFILQL